MVSKSSNRGIKGTSSSGNSTPEKTSSSRSSLRGLTFEEGEKQLAPVDARLTKPGTGARLTNANYAKLYDLYGKYQKAGSAKRESLLTELDQAIQAWLGVHDGSKKHDETRLPGVKQLAEQVRQALGGTSESETVETTQVEAPKDVKVEAPPKDTTREATLVVPEELTTVDDKKDVPPPQDAPPPPMLETTPTPIATREEKVEAQKENPVVAKLSDPKVELTSSELRTLEYGQILTYLDTRDRTVVEKLRTDNKFITKAESLGAEQLANIVCRILLRVPDSVVNKGGSREEAIRILSSQLRNAEVCKNLLANEAYVVIVPKNKVMTELPEFSQWAGTYTFDGRPWDITRGMGGVKSSRNTAIVEENLLGEQVDNGVSRKGWHSKEWMEHSKKNNNTELNEVGKDGPKDGDTGTKVFNAGVYCSGYSTTNHEFFHTIHSLGLNKTDHAKIQSEYDNKKKEPNATEWADGPRLDKSDNNSENYASSTVFEYFAQTGCAFQGTNVGTDPYTKRDRNNGRSWVDTNEPGLATILGKVCSDSELKNVNPRDAKKKPVETPKVEDLGKDDKTGKDDKGTTGVTPTGGSTVKKSEPETVEGGTKVGDGVGLIGVK